jgi:hypothetical protein
MHSLQQCEATAVSGDYVKNLLLRFSLLLSTAMADIAATAS